MVSCVQVDVSGIPPPLVGTKAVLMEEMQRKLAKRKARADGEVSWFGRSGQQYVSLAGLVSW